MQLKAGNAEGVRHTSQVLGAPIDVMDWAHAVERISAWAEARQSRTVFFCNAHSVVTGRRDPSFLSVLRHVDMAAADGAPVVWLMRRHGHPDQERIAGPDFMWRYLAESEARQLPVYFLGSSEETLAALKRRVQAAFPRLPIAGSCSPPYRPLSAEEDEALVDAINRSGAATVWVSLGCPKQEAWMNDHVGRVHAVMLGVGAAFAYHAGTLRRAPPWMQHYGLEWLYRLAQEPGRLWRRYFETNSLFLYYALVELVRGPRA